MNEYQRGFNEGLELAALKVQNLLGIPFVKLTKIAGFIRELKLTHPNND